jgi:hypothetical protein
VIARSGTERRESMRRRSDIESFDRCPKFDKHELTVSQIEEIAEKAAERAMRLMEDKKDIEFAQFVKKIGFSWGEKFLFVFGLLILWLLSWASNHGFKL